ncbi:MAG: IS21 family transposase [Deltaproteobacteria bacterium]|nr:IS21 family transposase [Deltaproteobacteria bacterium]
MGVTDAQVRKLMEERSTHGKIGRAAMMAGMDRKTARNYLRSEKLPSEMKSAERDYRTREDPFAEDWPMLEGMLGDAPALESKALFEWLMERSAGRYEPGQVRTLQRKIKNWRATKGPDKEVFFAQNHRPGEAMQMDFTNCNGLEITICGEIFEHLLCHCVLPFSNWEWGTICLSESLMAVRRGVQTSLFRLGRVPRFLQTDNLSAATHDLGSGKRAFNSDYEEFVSHFGMTPRKIGIGKSNQNGDVESSHNVLKRRLKQHLILRGSRDFESVEAYEKWVQEVMSKTNDLRTKKVTEELAEMKVLSANRLREHRVEKVRVSRESTIHVMRNTYSVPSRLKGEKVVVNVFDDRLEVLYGGKKQLELERLLGRKKHDINYRHIIWSLVQKPGAFQRYRYREELFPGHNFRQAYDALCSHLGAGYDADLEYLRILHRAASVSETEVEVALEILLSEGEVPLADTVKKLVQPEAPEVPSMAAYNADLGDYDALLDDAQEVMP